MTALTLDDFAGWVEKQPKRRRYDPGMPSNCAIAQFAKSLGFAGSTPGCEILVDGAKSIPIDGITHSRLLHLIGGHPFTFGALATRLRS